MRCWIRWRWRRIPNWLTVPATLAAIALHSIAAGWSGARLSLLGAALGLGLLLPFVLIRRLGAGDWTLVGGLGYWMIGEIDWAMLVSLLIGSIPGIIFGSHLAPRMPDKVIRPVLAITLALVALKLVTS